MGLLSVAKTVPQALTSLAGNIANLFTPRWPKRTQRATKRTWFGG